MQAQEQKHKLVSQRSVDLALRILGPLGANNAYYLEYLLCHFPHARALRALEWLHGKGIRGKLFEEFVRDECDSKPLQFCKVAFRGMDRDSELRKIYARDLHA